jgi:ribosomal protein L31
MSDISDERIIADADIKNLREALAAIKALVVGEKHPRWTDQHATTLTRGRIADICDQALSN